MTEGRRGIFAREPIDIPTTIQNIDNEPIDPAAIVHLADEFARDWSETSETLGRSSEREKWDSLVRSFAVPFRGNRILMEANLAKRTSSGRWQTLVPLSKTDVFPKLDGVSRLLCGFRVIEIDPPSENREFATCSCTPSPLLGDFVVLAPDGKGFSQLESHRIWVEWDCQERVWWAPFGPREDRTILWIARRPLLGRDLG